MKISRFIKNAAVLTFTALLLRIAGMGLRIYLANTIGSEGMGLYQLIFSVYVFAATFASSGFSIAVTRLICEENAGKKSIKHIMARSTLITLLFAFVTMAVLIFFAKFICIKFIGDIRAVKSVQILSLSLPFMAISSNIRGYFIAHKKVSVPSNSQLFEQLIRIILIVVIMPLYIQKGIEYSTAVLLFADTVAEAFSCIFIYIGYKIDLKKRSFAIANVDKPKNTVRKILNISMPITLSRYLTTLLRTVENLLIPKKLTQFNGDMNLSISQFGILKGMALPLIFFPASFLTALSTLLVPELSSAKSEATIKKAVEKTIRVTLTLSVFIGSVFFIFAQQISHSVYSNDSVAYYIKWLAPLIPLMYLESVTAGMMQGLDQQAKAFKYSFIDSCLRIILILTLLPFMGIKGFMIIMVISNLLTPLLNLIRLIKVSKAKFMPFEYFIKPMLISVFSALTSKMVISIFHASNLVMTCLYISLSALIYFALINIFCSMSIKSIIK